MIVCRFFLHRHYLGVMKVKGLVNLRYHVMIEGGSDISRLSGMSFLVSWGGDVYDLVAFPTELWRLIACNIFCRGA